MSNVRASRARRVAFGAACAALGVTCLAAAQPPAGTPPRDSRPRVTVVGAAQVTVAPDRAVVRLGAVAEAKNAGDAQAHLNDVMQNVLKAIQDLHVPASAIRTEVLSLSPVYASSVQLANRRGPEAPQISGYRAANVVSVALDDLSRIGPVVDAGITAGANELQGVSFELRDSAAARNEALSAAAKDARAQAEAVAAALGMRIDALDSMVANGSSASPPGPYFAARAFETSTPVQPGQLEVSSSVTATYFVAPR
jgi:uncharacterized protein YggE